MELAVILIPIIFLSLLLYFFLLGANNFIWSIKGLPIDKGSIEYKKRKRLFKILVVPIAGLLIIIWGKFS